jgi:hypothetical protein
MDLEETTARNDYAGEGQQQFMLEVSYLRVDICWTVVSCEIVANLQRHKHGAENLHCCESLLATRDEDTEALMFTVVIRKVCRLTIAL